VGLKRGFLLKGQERKGILKKTSPVDSSDAVVPKHGPCIAPKLAKKEGPTPAEQAAFSGLVVERTSTQTANRGESTEKRMSGEHQRKDLEGQRQAGQQSATGQRHWTGEVQERVSDATELPPGPHISHFKAKLLQRRAEEQC
jgi:hypothetical protein